LPESLELQGHDLMGVADTWWESSPPWITTMYVYRFFQKNGLGDQGGGVALSTGQQQGKPRPVPRDS